MPPPSKRRKTDSSAVEEIVFDTSARQEYLTGFHKRKLQRAKYAQDLAEKKAREEKLVQRRKLRQERKEELEEHLQAMNAGMAGYGETSTDDGEDNSEDNGAAGEWSGISDPPPPPVSTDVDHEEEYIDEEKYTTVTMEALDVSKEGIYKASKEEDHSPEPTILEEKESAGKEGRSAKKPWTKDKPKSHAAKPKKKKFRYESKAERKVTRLKEKSGNKKRAKARKSD